MTDTPPDANAADRRLLRTTVNGIARQELVEPRMLLSDFLRRTLHLTGTHVGCAHGVCGCCTVLVDGATARACLTFAVQVQDREVQSVEGLGEDPIAAALRASFHECHALQCGYCTPGFLMAARQLLSETPEPDEETIRVALSGNICRCTGYVNIVRAVRHAADSLAAARDQQQGLSDAR